VYHSYYDLFKKHEVQQLSSWQSQLKFTLHINQLTLETTTMSDKNNNQEEQEEQKGG
jgi:hypothetical protein